MRLDISDASIVVCVSRRNVLSLLHKLDRPGSARMLLSGNAYSGGTPINFAFAVRCEDDDEHYAGPAWPPGPMQLTTEQYLDSVEASRGTWSDDGEGEGPRP